MHYNKKSLITSKLNSGKFSSTGKRKKNFKTNKHEKGKQMKLLLSENDVDQNFKSNSPAEVINKPLKLVKSKKESTVKESDEGSEQLISTKIQNKKKRKRKKNRAINEFNAEEGQKSPKIAKEKSKSKSSKQHSVLHSVKQGLKPIDSKNNDSDLDLDSYPSDSESDSNNEPHVALKRTINKGDGSSDDSTSSDDESKSSHVSDFDMDSYPSDTDDEAEKNRGLPKNAIPSSELEEKEKRTIFVGNLPYLVERPELKKWFSKFGKVECVRLRSAPIANQEIPRKVAVIKKTFHEGRSNIHAYIRFHTLESAENAIQANGAVFNGHVLRVDHSKHEGKYDPKKAIFIGNVPFSLEEDSLREFFSECGDIESVRIVRDKNSGVGKGFAYVNFKCLTSVPLALKLDGEVLEKRELRVKPVQYAKKNAKSITQKFNPKFRGRNFPKQFKDNKVKNKGNKFQGEMSKRKIKKYHKKKSALDRKHDKFAKIFTNKSKKD